MTPETQAAIEAAFLAHCRAEPMASETDRRDHLVAAEFTAADVDTFLELYLRFGPRWRDHMEPS